MRPLLVWLLSAVFAATVSAVSPQSPSPSSSSAPSSFSPTSSFSSSPTGSLYWFTYCAASNSTGAVWSVSASGFLSLNLNAGVTVDSEWTGYPVLFVNGSRQFVDYLSGVEQSSAIAGLDPNRASGAADQLLRETFAGWSPDGSGLALVMSPAASLPLASTASVLSLTNGQYAQDATNLVVENGFKPNGKTQFQLLPVNASFELPQPCEELPPVLPEAHVTPAPPAVVWFNWTYCAASNTSVGGAWSVSAGGSMLLDTSSVVATFHALNAQQSSTYLYAALPILSITGQRTFTDYSSGAPVVSSSDIEGLVTNNGSSAGMMSPPNTVYGSVSVTNTGSVYWEGESVGQMGIQYQLSSPASLPYGNTSSTILVSSSVVENGITVPYQAGDITQSDFYVYPPSQSWEYGGFTNGACVVTPSARPTVQVPPAVVWFNWTYCAASNTSVGGAWSVSAGGSMLLDTSSVVATFHALNAQQSSTYLYAALPILSITGQRTFTDYSSGAPVVSSSDIEGLVTNNGSSAGMMSPPNTVYGSVSVTNTGSVYWEGESVGQMGIQYQLSSPASLPYGNTSSTILVSSSVVENGITVPYQAGDITQSDFYVYPPSQSWEYGGFTNGACVVTPSARPTVQVPPAVVWFNWTYCAASNTSVGGAWSVSAGGSMLLDTSSVVATFHALNAQQSSTYLYAALPILSITGQRTFTDYSSGAPVVSSSDIEGLVTNNGSSAGMMSPPNTVYGSVSVTNTGSVYWEGESVGQMGIQYQLSSPSLLPQGALANRITVTSSVSENGNTLSSSGDFYVYPPSQSWEYGGLINGACVMAVPGATYTVATQQSSSVSSSSTGSVPPSGPPPATLTVYWQYCQVSNTTSGAFSVSAVGSASINNSVAVNAYWTLQGSSGYSYFYQPSLFPLLSLTGVRTFVDYTFGSGTTSSNLTLAPFNVTAANGTTVTASNAFNLGGYVAGPQSSAEYFFSVSLYGGGLQVVSSPPAQLMSQSSLNSSSAILLSQASGVLLENGVPLAGVLGDTEQWTLSVSMYPFSACSLQVQPRIPPPPPTVVAYFTYCSAANTSLYGAWSVSVWGMVQLNNSAAQQAYGQWSSNAQSGTSYAWYNYPTLFQVLAINGSRTFTTYSAGGAYNQTSTSSTANITGLAPTTSTTSSTSTSNNQTGLPTQTLSVYGELYEDGTQFTSDWWSVSPWQAGIEYVLSSPAVLPDGTTAETVTLSSTMAENGIGLTYSAHDTSSYQFELQPYPLYSACTEQPQPRTPPPSSQVEVYWSYCSSFNTTVDGAWTVQASGVLVLDASAIVAQYNTLVGGGEISVQQTLPVLSMTGSRTFVDYSSGVAVSTHSNITQLLPNANSSLSVYAWVYWYGYVEYDIQGLSAAGLSFELSPAAAMPAGQQTSTITLTSGNVENQLSVPYTRGDVQSTQFYASLYQDEFYYNGTDSPTCYIAPQPRQLPPPATTSLYWTYCSAANSTVDGAWSVSAWGMLEVNTSSLQQVYASLNGSNAYTYTWVSQQLPVVSINGTRQFTDYSSGVPVTSYSNVTALVSNASTNNYNVNMLNVYVLVYSSGVLQFEGQSLTTQGISMALSPAAAMPEQQLASTITINQTNNGLSENGIAATGGTQFQANAYQSSYYTYSNGTWTFLPGCTETVPSFEQAPPGPPPATLTVYWQYCQVSNTTSGAFSVSAVGSASINNSVAVNAYWTLQGSSGYSYFYQPSLFPLLSLTGVRTFVDYTFGSGTTSSNLTLAPFNVTAANGTTVTASNAFNLGGYVAGPQSSAEYFFSVSLYGGGLQVVSSPPAQLMSQSSLNSSSAILLSQASGVLLENGVPLAGVLGDTEQWTLSVSMYPFSACSLQVQPRIPPPPPTVVAYFTYCSAANTSLYGAWSVSVWGMVQLNNSAAQQAYGQWSSNAQSGTSYAWYNYPTLFQVLAINGSRIFTTYSAGGAYNQTSTSSTANITGLAPTTSTTSSTSTSNNQTGLPTQTLSVYGELYEDGTQFTSDWWSVSPWQAGIEYVLSSPAVLPDGTTAETVTLSSTMAENGIGLTYSAHDTSSYQFELQPYPLYSACTEQPQPRTPPPSSQVEVYWSYCSSFNTTVDGAWTVQASGVLVLDASAIVAQYNTLVGGGEISVQQTLPVLSMTGSRTFVDYSSGVAVSTHSNITQLLPNANSSLSVYAWVYWYGYVEYDIQGLSAAGLSFELSPAAAMPAGQQTSTITLTSGNVENQLSVPYTRGDVQSTQFYASLYQDEFYYNGTDSPTCYIAPQPRQLPPPATTSLYWTYCSAANSTVDGAWSVSAWGMLEVNTSSLQQVYASLNGSNAYTYTWVSQQLPVVSINGTRQFTDYSSGVPVTSYSNVTALVSNASTNNYNVNMLNVYVLVYSSGVLQFEGQSLTTQGISMALSPAAAMPEQQLASTITINQTNNGLSENGIAATGGTQFQANAYQSSYYTYSNGTWTFLPGCTETVPSFEQAPPGPPPATLTVYWQYCQVSNTTSGAFSVSAVGSASINNSVAVNAYWTLQGSSGYSYFYQPSLFPLLSLTGVRTFVDYTFGSGTTSSNLTLAPFNVTAANGTTVTASNAFNLGGYVAGPQSSAEYFFSVSLYGGGLQVVSSPPAQLMSQSSLNSSSAILLSQASGVLLENGVPLAGVLGDTEQWTLSVSMYPFSACSLQVQPRIPPPPPTVVAYFTYCSAANTSLYGAWSVSVWGMVQLNNSAAQQAYGQWSSNAQSGTSYAWYNYPTLFQVLAINGSRTFTTYSAGGAYNQTSTSSTANITGLAPTTSTTSSTSTSNNQTGLPTQTLSVYGELYEDGTQFTSDWWSVSPWQAGIEYVLSSPAVLPDGTTAETVTLSSTMAENGIGLTYSAHDTSSYQFELQPYPLYSACTEQPQPRTPPPSSQVEVYWSYCSSFNTTVDGAWTVQASGVLVLDASAIVAQYNTLVGGGEISVQQTLPVLSMTGSRTFVDYSSGVAVSTHSNITQLLPNANSSLSVYAWVYWYGYVEYDIQGLSAAGLSFELSPAAAMPAGQQTSTITLTSGNVENQLSVPYTRGDVQSTQFYASLYQDEFYYNGTDSPTCYIAPQPRQLPPPATTSLYWTYCSAANSTVDGAWSVSAWGMLEVNTSSLQQVYASLNGSNAYTYTWVSQQLPVVSINGTRQFTDYSSGVPVTSYSNVTALVSNASTNNYNVNMLNVYVLVYSSGVLQFEGQSLTTQGISMALSPAAAMPEQQLASTITINQTNNGLSENGIAATGGTQFQANAYQSSYYTYSNGTWTFLPGCTETVPSFEQAPPGPPPATLTVYWQYCQVSNTTSGAFSVSAVGSASINNSVAVNAYWTLQGSSGYSYFYQPSLFPLLSLTGVRTFVDYTFGSGTTSSNLTLAPFNVTAANGTTVTASNAFNLGGYVAGPQSSAEYFFSVSLYGGGLQVVSSPPAQLMSQSSLNSSSAILLSQASGVLLENGVPLAGVLGDTEQWTLSVSMYPFSACSLQVQPRIPPPPPTVVAYFTYCSAANTSLYGAWSVSVWGMVQLNNSAAQQAYGQWSSNAQSGTSYAWYNYPTLFQVLAINGSRTFTTYSAGGAYNQTSTSSTANITGLAPTTSTTSSTSTSNNQTGLPTQTLSVYGELYEDGTQFTSDWWSVSPWQAGIEYVLSSPAVLPDGTTAETVTLSSTMAENGIGLTYSAHDTSSYQFELQPYPLYSACTEQPQPRTPPPSSQVEVYWSYCSSFNTTVDGAWTVQASGVLVLDASAIVAQYNTLVGGGEISVQQTLPVLSMTGSRTFVDYSSGVAVSTHSNITQLLPNANSSLSVYAWVYWYGYVEYDIQGLSAAGLSFELSPAAAMPAGQQTSTITLTSGNVENQLSVPYTRGDVQSTQFYASLYQDEFYYNGTDSPTCYIAPQPRQLPPPATTSLYWTYCSAANSTVDGAWSVSAWGMLEVNTSSLQQVYASLNGSNAYTYTWVSQQLPVVSINGTRQFTDYSSGVPVTSYSNVTALVSNASTNNYNVNMLNVYVLVYSSGVLQFEGQSLTTQGISMALSPAAAMPEQQLASTITINQTNNGLSENGIAATGGTQFQANAYQSSYYTYSNGTWTFLPGCTETVPSFASSPVSSSPWSSSTSSPYSSPWSSSSSSSLNSSSSTSAAANVFRSLTYPGASHPSWLAVGSNGTLYVADDQDTAVTLLSSIYRATNSGTVLRTLNGTGGSSPYSSGGVAVDSAGNIYFLVSGSIASSSVVVLSRNNNYTVLLSVPGSSIGLSSAYGIALDQAGNVYIADSNNNRVVVLASLSSATPLRLLATLNATTLTYPFAVAVDAFGQVYVADRGAGRVVVLAGLTSASPGSLLFATSNVAAGGFDNVVGIALDYNGTVYVSDSGANSLVVLHPVTGTSPLAQIASYPTPSPAGVAVDQLGASYVVSGNNVIVRLGVGDPNALLTRSTFSSSTGGLSPSSSYPSFSLSNSSSSSSSFSSSSSVVSAHAAAVTACNVQFNSSVSQACGVSSPSSVGSFCSLSCSAVYGAWLNSCTRPLSLNVSSSWSAIVSFNASCSACAPSSVPSALFSTCGILRNTTSSNSNGSVDSLYSWQWPSTCSANCTSLYNSQLLPFYNSCVAGYPTVPAAATTFFTNCAPRTAPQAVTSLSTFVLSSTSVSLSWSPATVQTPPSDAVLYFITRTPLNSTATAVNTSVGNVTYYVDNGAQANTAYSYTITANNSVGMSPPSLTVYVTTPDAPPIAPAVLAVSNMTATMATASWTPSVSPDGTAVYYQLSRQQALSSTGASIVYRGSATSFTFVDLVANTTYWLTVQSGTTLAGLSANSTGKSFTSLFSAPSAPTALSIVSSNLSTIALQWATPYSVGSNAVQSYVVALLNNATQQLQPVARVSGVSFTSSSVGLALSPVTRYSFAVSAVNSANLTGAYTAVVFVTTPANAPTVLRPPTVSLAAAGGSATVSFNLASSGVVTGGSPLTTLHLSLSSLNDSREVNLAPTSFTSLSSLLPNTTYSVVWRAANAYGWSANSNSTTFVTRTPAPVIVSLVAGDSTATRTTLGAGSTITVTFNVLTSQPSLSSQSAINALFVFTPSLPGTWSCVWTTTANGTSAAVLTLVTPSASSVVSFPIGLVTVTVNGTLTDFTGQSASAQGAVSPVLSGTWYGLPRSVRYFASVQQPVTVVEDSSLNPLLVQQATGVYQVSSAVLTYIVTAGSLSPLNTTILRRFSASVVAALPRNVTLLVPYSNLSALVALSPVLYTPTPLSQTADVLSVSVSDILTTAAAYPSDACTVAIAITPVNHAPTLQLSSTSVPAMVFGSSYPLPAVNVSDVDAVYALSWPLAVLMQAVSSTTASFTVSSSIAVPSTLQLSVASGQSASSVQVSGPLAALNAYLALSPFLFADPGLSPSAPSTGIVYSVNDTGNGNGGASSLTAQLSVAIAITCLGTAAPALVSAGFSNDAGSVTLTFAAVLDQTAATSSNCSLFFDVATMASLGSGATCGYSGASSVLVQLGYGASLLPNTNITLVTSSALRRCAGGLTTEQSIAVSPPSAPTSPVVSILGATIISSCDNLTLYGQATGLGGRPSSATYSWSVAVGLTNDSTTAALANSVLGSGGNTSTLTLTSAQLYKQSAYYFFYLTVGNFLGVYSTSSWMIYKSSLPLPQLLVQGASSLSHYPSDSFSLTVTPVLSTCLQGAQALSFSWSVQPAVNLSSVINTQPQINVPAFLLSPGYYVFTLKSQVISNPSLVTSTTISVQVLTSPVTVSISNGAVQQFSELAAFTLNSTVQDPNVAVQSGAGWSYTWSCVTSVGVTCQDNLLGNALATSSTSSQLVPAGHLTGGVYVWTVLANKGNSSATASVTVSVTTNQLPLVGITSYSTLINPSGSLFYAASVTDLTSTPLAYSWSQVSGPALNLSAIARSLTQTTLVLNNAGATVFTAGSTYTFQFTATNGFNQSGFGQVSVTINAPPHGGSLQITPAEGYGYDTPFSITAPGWQSSTQKSLSYQVFQMAADGSLTALGPNSGLATQSYQLAQSGSTAEKVTIVLAVQDSTGATSAVSVQVTVVPNPHSLGGAVVDFISGLLSGSVSSASATSNNVALFASLNQYKDTLDASLSSNSSANNATTGRRLLSFSAASVAGVSLQTGKQLSVVNSNYAQVDVATALSAALKQTQTPASLSLDTVKSSGLSLLAGLSNSAALISRASASGQAAALQATQSLLQFAQQQLAAVLLNQTSTTPTVVDLSIQPTVEALLSNISAQGAALSTNGLTVAGQSYSFAGSALSAVVSRAAVTDNYVYTAPDSSSVTFADGSMAGTVSVDGSVQLGNTSDSLLDTQVWYLPASPYLWTVNTTTTLLSSVLSFTRLTTGALELAPMASDTQPTALLTLVFNSSLVDDGTQPACAMWDDSSASWQVESAYLTSGDPYLSEGGQSVVECAVLSVTAATVAVVAQNISASGVAGQPQSSGVPSSSTTSPSVTGLSSSSSYWPALSSSCSSTWAAASTGSLSSSSSSGLLVASTGSSSSRSSATATNSWSSSSSSALVYPSGSVRITFSVEVDISEGAINVTLLATELREDIAYNLARLLVNRTQAELLPFVLLVSINGTTLSVTWSSNGRRLLAELSAIPVAFVLLSDVSSLSSSSGGAVNTNGLVASFITAAQHGLATPNSNATIPEQTPSAVDANEAAAASSSSSSSGASIGGGQQSSSSTRSLTIGLAVGLTLGLGAAVLLVVFALLWKRHTMAKLAVPSVVSHGVSRNVVVIHEKSGNGEGGGAARQIQTQQAWAE